MTHLTPGDTRTIGPPRPFDAAPSGQREFHTASCRLDRDRLQAGIASRRLELTRLECALVTACENAARRGARRGVRIGDRETWDRATWQRYLDGASRLEPEYGPRMRQLLREIDQLTRLAELPVGR
jgi:hypothetical protein